MADDYLPFRNHLRLRGTKLDRHGKRMIKCVADCRGAGNVISLAPGGYMKNCRFFIRGNHNQIIVEKGSSVIDGEFYIEDDHNLIYIGKGTTLTGKIHLACIEGCKIEIGDRCLFSSEITFRTGDSHSVLDMSGKRINPSKEIKIGEHVWIGHQVTVHKGVTIPEDSIVGARAVVTKSVQEPHVIIAGCPAGVVKEQVTWSGER